MTTAEVSTVKEEQPKEKRVCSECGSQETRIHHWGPVRQSDGTVAEYPQWYHNKRGGFYCYSCYMKKFWEKRKCLDKKEKKGKKKKEK